MVADALGEGGCLCSESSLESERIEGSAPECEGESEAAAAGACSDACRDSERGAGMDGSMAIGAWLLPMAAWCRLEHTGASAIAAGAAAPPFCFWSACLRADASPAPSDIALGRLPCPDLPGLTGPPAPAPPPPRLFFSMVLNSEGDMDGAGESPPRPLKMLLQLLPGREALGSSQSPCLAPGLNWWPEPHRRLCAAITKGAGMREREGGG